jgi:peptide/nickel transport system substrate-binding protein
MLTDYVPSSSVTLVKNPNYWMKDPVGSGIGNQLPYLDSVRYVIIPDNSSRQAALRTGKIDVLHGVAWTDAESLKETSSELLEKKFYGTGGLAISMRTDKLELPFSKKDVRRALMMATDFETIKNDYCGGDAQILTWPIIYQKEYAEAYLPLEEAPASVQELYVYNPDKAKTLLTNAGYPDGFKAKIVCTPTGVDYLSIIKDMWAKVGVTLDIDPVEVGAFTGITASRQYDEMIFSGAGLVANLYIMENLRGHIAFGNLSYINDPQCEEAYNKMCELSVLNPIEADRVYKELMPYVLDQAWAIPYVTSASYNMWWPWLKNYHGELDLGRSNFPKWARFVWIDQELKKSMGY